MFAEINTTVPRPKAILVEEMFMPPDPQIIMAILGPFSASNVYDEQLEGIYRDIKV